MANTWRTTGQSVAGLTAFDDAIEAYMKGHDVPNGALAVANGRRLVLARGYTWAEPGHETTQPTSLFRLASLTKPITRIAVYQLTEGASPQLALNANVQGVLGLTAPDGTPPPSDPAPADPNTAGRYYPSVTVANLLRHRGGWDRGIAGEPTFFRDPDVASAFGKELPVTQLEIARWGVTQPMQFWPGTRFSYSNFGFNLLGLVIQQVTGLDYIRRVRESIFAPLGVQRPRMVMPLERSRAPGEVEYFPANPEDKPDLTGGGGQVPVQYGGENHANFSSLGGWVMAAPDYARVLAAYSDPTPPTAAHLRDMLGSPSATRAGVSCTEHGGEFPGTRTYMGLRTDGIAIVTLFNKDAPETFQWQGSTRDRSEVLHEIAGGVTSWPSNDLFPSVLTAPLPPGPEKLHVFFSGADKPLRDAQWERSVAGRWLGWWRVREGSAPAGAPVTAVSRRPSMLDCFHVGNDGRIYTAAWEAGRTAERWRGWWPIQEGKAPVGSAVTAVARHPDKLDVFVVGTDGGVYTAAWAQGVGDSKWRGWWRIGSLQAKPGTPVAAVARDQDRLDVFVAGADGKTYTAAWKTGDSSWRGWWNILDGHVPAGGAVTAVSRHPSKLDVFLTSNDGGVYTAAWEQGVADSKWRGWWRIGSLQAKPGTPVAAVARDQNKLDVFAAGADGKTYTAAWAHDQADGKWRGWWNILDGHVPAGGAVTAVSRHPSKLDVFLTSNDGGVYTAAWEHGVADSKWRGWWRIGSAQGKAGAPVGALARRLG